MYTTKWPSDSDITLYIATGPSLPLQEILKNIFFLYSELLSFLYGPAAAGGLLNVTTCIFQNILLLVALRLIAADGENNLLHFLFFFGTASSTS